MKGRDHRGHVSAHLEGLPDGFTTAATAGFPHDGTSTALTGFMRMGDLQGDRMRVTNQKSAEDAGKPMSLEAEAAAWRSKHAGRSAFVAGKVPVVRIHRRSRPPSWPNPQTDRPIAAARP